MLCYKQQQCDEALSVFFTLSVGRFFLELKNAQLLQHLLVPNNNYNGAEQILYFVPTFLPLRIVHTQIKGQLKGVFRRAPGVFSWKKPFSGDGALAAPGCEAMSWY